MQTKNTSSNRLFDNDRERDNLLKLLSEDPECNSLYKWIIDIVNRSIWVPDTENVVTVFPNEFFDLARNAIRKNPRFMGYSDGISIFWADLACKTLMRRLCQREPLKEDYFSVGEKWRYGK